MKVDKDRTECLSSSRSLQPSKPSPKAHEYLDAVMCGKGCVRQGSQPSRAPGAWKGEGGRLQEERYDSRGAQEGSEKRSHDFGAL